MFYDLSAAAAESIPALLSTAAGVVVTYFATRRKNRSDVSATDAATVKTKVETVALVMDELDEATEDLLTLRRQVRDLEKQKARDALKFEDERGHLMTLTVAIIRAVNALIDGLRNGSEITQSIRMEAVAIVELLYRLRDRIFKSLDPGENGDEHQTDDGL